MLNFSQFLSCVGLTVQETTTLMATFTATETVTTGYTTMTVAGCTPYGFPYVRCPSSDEALTVVAADFVATSTPFTPASEFTVGNEAIPTSVPPVLVEKDGVPDERD